MSLEFQWNGLVLVPLFSLALNLSIAAVIVRKNPRWIVARVFLLMVVFSMVLNVSVVFVTLMRPELAALSDNFWGRVGWTATTVLIPLSVQFALTAARHEARAPTFRTTDGLFYAPAALFLTMIWATQEVVGALQVQPLRVNSLLAPTPWGTALAAYALLPVLALFVLYRERRRASDEQARTQFKWLIIGLSIPIISGATFSLLPRVGITNAGFPTFSLSLAIAMAALGYGIVRYRLFDIKVRLYIRRALILLGASGFALAFVLGIVSLVALGLGPLFAENQATTVLAALVPSLLLFRFWERLGTWIIESAFPSLKWKESEVGDVFLVSNTGLLITRHRGTSKLKVNEGIMVSMLTAIQDFLTTSLEGPGAAPGKHLNVMSYGETKLLIEHGPECYMVVVFDGFETDAMRTEVRRTLAAIHERHGADLRGWDGGRWIRESMDPLIESMLAPGGGSRGAT